MELGNGVKVNELWKGLGTSSQITYFVNFLIKQ